MHESPYWDPYRVDITENPYPFFKRLREEAPLYYNEEYDFYAVSRYDDVKRGLSEHQTFISSRGGILELMRAGVEIPKGVFIFEDPPLHTVHRGIVARMFTPRRINGLEEQIRALTRRTLDRLVGRDEIDFIADVGAVIPMAVIGMLLGIPEEDQQRVRQITDERMRTKEAGKPLDYSSGFQLAMGFEEYLDWRAEHPSDDVMTELLNVEFTDEQGVKRKLTREELVTFCNVLAGAGNETTNRLIGWTAKVLAEHPDQRRLLLEQPELIPDAIEEVLRFEPPAPHVGRWIARDTEFQGQRVPAGKPLLCLVGAANRDEEKFPDGERFDIRRERRVPHLTFGTGIHTCIGNVLARMEGRIVLEELLARFPEWEVDLERARLIQTSTVRGWETLPAWVGQGPRRSVHPAPGPAPQPSRDEAEAPPARVEGSWRIVVQGPTGPMPTTLRLVERDGALVGEQSGEGSTSPVEGASYEPSTGEIRWQNRIEKPMRLTAHFAGTVRGGRMAGEVKVGFIGKSPFTGERLEEAGGSGS